MLSCPCCYCEFFEGLSHYWLTSCTRYLNPRRLHVLCHYNNRFCPAQDSSDFHYIQEQQHAKTPSTSPSSLSRLRIMKVTFFALIRRHRNGREHEAHCLVRPGAHRRGAQSPLRRIEERHWCPLCILKSSLFNRAEGRAQGQ